MYFTEIIQTSGNTYEQKRFDERSKRFPSEQQPVFDPYRGIFGENLSLQRNI